MPINDVYSVDVVSSLAGVEMHNIYYYLGLTVDATAENIAAAFQIDRLILHKRLVDNTMSFTEIVVKCVSGLVDEFVFGLNAQNGERLGEYLPLFNCWAFELSTSVAGRRNGRKAIGGIVEPDTQDGAPFGTVIANIDDYCAGMIIPLDFNGQDMAQLGLWRDTMGLGSYAPVDAVTFKRMSTQNSRKNF